MVASKVISDREKGWGGDQFGLTIVRFLGLHSIHKDWVSVQKINCWPNYVSKLNGFDWSVNFDEFIGSMLYL